MTSTGDTAPHRPTRDELMAATDELAPVEPAPPRGDPPELRRAFADELPDADYERTLSVLVNAIGFEVCHADGRPRELADDGNVKIEVDELELARHKSAAVRVLRALEELGFARHFLPHVAVVGPVVPGSIVSIPVPFGTRVGADVGERVRQQVAGAIGHDDFAVVFVDGAVPARVDS